MIFKKNHGFSLLELTVAVGAVSFLTLAYSSLNTNVLTGERRNKSRIDATTQRSAITARLLTASPKDANDTCKSRLGLKGSEVFSPTAKFDIPGLASVAPAEHGVRLDRVYLNNAILTGNDGKNLMYRTLLMVQQTDVSSAATPVALSPTVLGVMKITVNGAQKIIACSWDAVKADATTFCESIDGATLTGAGGGNCKYTANDPDVATGACPGKTTLVANRCVPADVYCYNHALGKDFDGNLLACNAIPTSYGVRYPAGYIPPVAPSPMPVPTPSPAQTPAPTPLPPASNTDHPAISPCDCNGNPMPAGGTEKCVMAHYNNEGFGNYDDIYEVQVCDSAGHIVAGNPSGYFNEEGNGASGNQWPSGYKKIANCQSFGGHKTENGKNYTTGYCY